MVKRFAGTTGVAGEIRGGLAGAMVALGIVLPLGLLAMSALGPAAASIGVRAAFISAILGGLVATLLVRDIVPISIPKTSTTLIFAGFVGTLAADPTLRTAQGPDIATILGLATLCVAAAGALQLLMGLARLGSLIHYVPLPVVAGFMDGVAILIALSQLRVLFGLSGAEWDFGTADGWRHVATPGTALGLFTAALAALLAWRVPRWPWSLVGFAAGTGAYYAIRLWLPDADLGALPGPPAGGLPDSAVPELLTQPSLQRALIAHLPQFLATAGVLALIAAMDGLLSAVAMDATRNTRHDANRLLVGHGIANIAAGAFGGLPVAYSTAVPRSVVRAGGRSWMAGCVIAAMLLVMLVFGRRLLGLIPAVVSAGIMLVVALGLFDQWSGQVLRQLRIDRDNREALWSLAVVLIVCVATIAFGFVVSIAVGVLLSCVLFIETMNRSLVRSIGTGATRASRRIYYPGQEALLRERGARIKIVELEGAIFFGTAEKLTRQVETLAGDARYVIVDVKRVTTVDASGTMALERMARQLRDRGVALLLSGLVAGDRHARALVGFGSLAEPGQRLWFADADRALEHAERGLLDEAGVVRPDVELPFEELSLAETLTAAQRDTLQQRLLRVLLAPGEVLFRKGEPGDRLFVLARGSVSILSNSGDAATAQRLASFAPGVIFGETAMLDGGGRTATGVADEESVVYVLTREALDEIRRSDPALATQLLVNLARQLSARLRFASATIQAADY